MTETMRNSISNLIEQVTEKRWQAAIWTIAFLPFIQALLSWDLDGNMAGFSLVVRHLSIPAIIGETIIIAWAMTAGLSFTDIIKNLQPKILILLSIWSVFALSASFFVAHNPANSAMILYRFILHGFFLAALIFLIQKANAFEIEHWLNAMAIGIIAYVAALTIFVLIVPDPANFPWVISMPSATNIRQIANIIAIPSTAAIALLLYGKASYRLHSGLIVLLTVAFIAWSGSRAALIGISASSILAIFAARSMPQIKNIASLLFSGVIGLVIAAQVPTPDPSFGLMRMVNSVGSKVDVSSGRLEIWKITLNEIAKAPFFGHGSGEFRDNMGSVIMMPLNHPHNFILQFIYDWGIFGGGAFLILLGIITIKICKTAPNQPLAGFAAAAGCFSLLCIGMIDGALFYPLTILAAITLAAPLLGRANKIAEGTDSS